MANGTRNQPTGDAPGRDRGLLRSDDLCATEDEWRMVEASRIGDSATVSSLLQAYPALSGAQVWYTTPLHFAVGEGHIDVVRLLLEAGADPTVTRHTGESPVMTARDRGHEDIVRLLEEWIARTTSVRPEDHEIHRAVVSGDLSRVGKLVEGDPSLANRGDSHGRTPLHLAVPGGSIDMVGCLIDHGADVNAVQSWDGPYGAYRFRPVDLALWNGIYWGQRNDYEMAGYLLERGADYTLTIAAALGDIAHVGHLLDAEPGAVHQAQPCGKRPLSSAVERSHVEIVRLLLERGADPSLPEGSTAPRGLALHRACEKGDVESARLLLEHGADPNASVDSSGSCLFVAKAPDLRCMLYEHGAHPMDAFSYVWEDNIDAVALMASQDPEAVASSGCGGVFAAVCTLGKREWMQMLLRLGVRVPPVVTGCRSYLWTHPDMTRVLLEHGMDPNLPDWRYATPLHSICGRDGRGRPDENRAVLLDLFLEFGANINAIDEDYRSTPLGWAARNDLLDMVELLLARGADAELAAADWAAPLAWAERRGHRQVAQMLRPHLRQQAPFVP